ncbi:hypothetical protein CLOSTMETH_00280 [[Clostridium] methylpentosum DSM 5476]|uniref:Uncharacterized protein n=1 Tax=[Clostridium] methylpentosum DSM 5476 TaxID=537013 RepID=C0E8Y5_9FIRM|nr:hypothetical protein CLOSTMETH_00280 [[Clostridium] methylpentosum DSM 5476]MDY3988765.1 hypothetical protein [Massilioclostridium sp.]
MRTLNSKVMSIANKLVAQGYNRANAMIKAWALVKMPQVITKAAGVTYGKRQKALEHLAHYAPEQISIRLERERDNEFDRNAVVVIATVQGKGSLLYGIPPPRAGGLCGSAHGRRKSGSGIVSAGKRTL